MNSSISCAELFRRVYAEQGLDGSPNLHRTLDRLAGLPVAFVPDKGAIPPEDLNRHTLFLCRPRGRTVTRCPGSQGHLCCNYLTVDLYLGCTLACAYCIMRSYLNFSPVTVYLDPEPALQELRRLARRNPDRMVRAGTGEVGDSLLLDPLFGLSETFIRALAPYPNVYFELKTKSHYVDHLLEIEEKGNAVIGFSLNPQRIIDTYEGTASSLKQRLAAARKAAESGYLISFHFDPVLSADDGMGEYLQLIAALDGIPEDRVAWISLGTFRYTAELKHRLGETQLLYEEFVLCRDGKYRYMQKTRSRLYQALHRELRRRFPAPIYLCMESPAVWRNVFGAVPREIPGVSAIFRPIRGL